MKSRPMILRSVLIDDIEVARSGDGRTVTAYAATFGEAYSVNDQFGSYDEVINRAAFNRAVKAGIERVGVLFNHGRTPFGTPSDKWSAPVGTPIEVKPDGKGLLTVTRYSATPTGEEALQLIADGAVRFMSFRGPVIRSGPTRTGPGGRPTIERLELGLTEYGPTQFPVNHGAEIMALRSQLIAEQIGEMTPEERAELIDLLKAGAPLDELVPTTDTHESQPAAPAEPPAAPVDAGPSLTTLELEQAQRRRLLEA